jgi:hypothetical protein
MAEPINPAASDHLPSFITAPGETDVLMVAMGIVLVIAILMFGIFFFRLHTLPERLAHKSQKIQFEIVAVLGLIALFTHMHIFWLIGLVLALIELPDFSTPLNRVVRAVERLAGIRPSEGPPEARPEKVAGVMQETAAASPLLHEAPGLRDGKATLPVAPAISPASQRELDHA